MIEGEPTWIGADASAVLAWIHTPEDATSRGIVVVAPPAGRELMLSELTVRRLCILLARQGYTAVRFGWRGSKDSQLLSATDDAVVAWQQDLAAVVEATQGLLGADDLPVDAIGYRTGAAVVGSVAERFRTVVSWEPLSGQAFVRQWSRLRGTVAGHVPASEGLIDLLGMALTQEQTDQFSALPAPRPGDDNGSTPVVEVKEADRRRAKAMYAVEPFDLRLHDDVFRTVIDALPGGDPQPVAARLATVRENTWTDSAGNRLNERIVEIGPERRIGVVTWRDQEGAPGKFHGAHGVLVSGGGPDGRVGSGEWPMIARELAADGIVTLRVDRPLVGDSTPVDALRATNSYTLRSALSFRESLDWLRVNGCGRVSAALLCASAWAACLGELHDGAAVDAETIVLVGHSEWKMDQQLWAEAREFYNADAPRDAPAASNRAARSEPALRLPDPTFRPGLVGLLDRSAWAREVFRVGGVRELKRRAREAAVVAVRTRMPYVLWRVAGRLGVMETPERVLEPMTRHARVVVLNGPDDLPRWVETRADRAVERLAAAGRDITAIASDRLDHSVITATGCRTVLDTLRQQLVTREAPKRPAAAGS